MRRGILLPLLLGVLALAAPAAFAKASAPRVVVAVVDSGVTPTKQLAPRLLPGWDFVDGDSTPNDQNGHGSEIASIVAKQCGGCAILPVRVIGGAGLGTADLASQGIQWAVAHGAQVVNLSMTTASENPVLADAIEAAVHAGVTVVVAAGNAGEPVGYPGASAPDAITVGSVDTSGNRYSWSNYGPWVSAVAPGVIPARTSAGKLVSAVGTSASAGYVSGLVGRALSCQPSLTPAQARSLASAGSLPTC
jgi:thermitase